MNARNGYEGKYCEECADCLETCRPLERTVINAWNNEFWTNEFESKTNGTMRVRDSGIVSSGGNETKTGVWKPKIIFVDKLRIESGKRRDCVLIPNISEGLYLNFHFFLRRQKMHNKSRWRWLSD